MIENKYGEFFSRSRLIRFDPYKNSSMKRSVYSCLKNESKVLQERVDRKTIEYINMNVSILVDNLQYLAT